MTYAPASEPATPTTTATDTAANGEPNPSSPRAARNPAGIITTSLGNGTKLDSMAMKTNTNTSPHVGASAAMVSRCDAMVSSMAANPHFSSSSDGSASES